MTNPLEQIRGYMSSRVVSSIRDRSKGVRIRVGSDIHLAEMLLVKIEAILDASQGYVCVPVEPTQDMLDAASDISIPSNAYHYSDIDLGETAVMAVYKAMLAASKETNNE